MSTLALIVLAFHSLLVAWLLHDSFRTANRWADIFEAHILPAWARWDTYGDPVSWVHHGMVAAGVALYGAAWGWILPDSAAMGALVGASVAFVAYGIREGMSAWESWRAGRPHVWTHPLPHRVGWAVDGLMDLVGPGLVLAGCLAWGGV